MPRDILEHHLEDQARHRVEVAGEGLAADAQSFEGNRAATGERIDHQRRLLRIGRPHQCAANLQVLGMCRQVPVGEVRDEFEQRFPQVFIRRTGRALHGWKQLPRLALELRRATRIARVGPEQG